jgi:hypothetical protein
VPQVTVASRLSGTPAPTATVVARPRRSEARARRVRRRRRQRFAVVAGIAALAVLAGWFVWRGGDDTRAPVSGPGAQQLVLIQVLAADRRSIVQALVAHDPANGGRGSLLLVPSQLIVDAPGVGSKPLGEVAPLPGENRSAESLSDLLGVRVDGTWALTERGLAGLVDAVGGVDIDVRTAVVRAGAEILPVGRRRLDGPAAAAYATFLAPGEPEQQRLARFGEVLRQVLVSLPPEDAAARSTVARIADQARSTLPTGQLAGLLSALHADMTRDRAAFDSLPVRTIDAGGGSVSFGIDEAASEPLLRTMFGRALIQREGGQVRVLVQNGPRVPGLVESARKRLVDGGYRFVNGGNSAKAADQSVVIIRDGSPEARATGEGIARSLGLPASTLRLGTQGQTVADVIVVLGRDYKP